MAEQNVKGESKELSPKQVRFVEEYLVDLNATQAALRAGYSARTAGSQGARLLKNVKVLAAITEALTARSERTKVDADYVLKQAVQVHERCMQEVAPITVRGHQVTDADGNALFKFDAASAIRALELIGKHVAVNAFKEHLDLSGELTAAIKVQFVDPSD